MKELQKVNVKLMVFASVALGHDLPHPTKRGKYVCKKCGGHLIVGELLVTGSDEVLRPCGSEFKSGDDVRHFQIRRALCLALFNRDSVELPSSEMLENYDFEQEQMVDRIERGE